MHYVDTDKTYREKAWQQLEKNATSYIEQILEEMLYIDPWPSRQSRDAPV